MAVTLASFLKRGEQHGGVSTIPVPQNKNIFHGVARDEAAALIEKGTNKFKKESD